jgi:hypothetical protein
MVGGHSRVGRVLLRRHCDLCRRRCGCCRLSSRISHARSKLCDGVDSIPRMGKGRKKFTSGRGINALKNPQRATSESLPGVRMGWMLCDASRLVWL